MLPSSRPAGAAALLSILHSTARTTALLLPPRSPSWSSWSSSSPSSPSSLSSSLLLPPSMTSATSTRRRKTVSRSPSPRQRAVGRTSFLPPALLLLPRDENDDDEGGSLVRLRRNRRAGTTAPLASSVAGERTTTTTTDATSVSSWTDAVDDEEEHDAIAIMREGVEEEVAISERALAAWVDRCRTGDGEPPDARAFEEVIAGLTSLPPSFPARAAPDERGGRGGGGGVGTTAGRRTRRTDRADRASRALDLMEAHHEPPVRLYDAVIASHCADVLDRLSSSRSGPTSPDDDVRDNRRRRRERGRGGGAGRWEDGDAGDGDDRDLDDEGGYHGRRRAAYRSARSALRLLNRSEELYRETGGMPSRLPGISSYVAVMDAWKALAVDASSWKDGGKGKRKHTSFSSPLPPQSPPPPALSPSDSAVDETRRRAVRAPLPSPPPRTSRPIRRACDSGRTAAGRRSRRTRRCGSQGPPRQRARTRCPSDRPAASRFPSSSLFLVARRRQCRRPRGTR